MNIRFSLLPLLFASATAFAQSNPPPPGSPTSTEPVSGKENPIEFKGRIFAFYQADQTEGGKNQRGFDIDRAYLQMSYKFDPNWQSVALLDAKRVDSTYNGTKNTTSYNTMYLRNAYIQGLNLGLEGSVLRFGLQPYGYAVIDTYLGTRWLAKSVADEVFNPYAPTNNGGISYKVPLFGMLDLSVAAINGREDTSKSGNTSDDGIGETVTLDIKAIQNGDTIKKAGLLVHYETHDEYNDTTGTVTAGADEAKTQATFAALYLNSDIIDTALEYGTAKRSDVIAGLSDKTYTAYGLTMNLKFGDWSLYARHIIGADDDTKKDLMAAKSFTTIGPTYTIVKGKISTGLIFEERKAFDDATSTGNGAPAGKDRKVIQWRWLAQF